MNCDLSLENIVSGNRQGNYTRISHRTVHQSSSFNKIVNLEMCNFYETWQVKLLLINLLLIRKSFYFQIFARFLVLYHPAFGVVL